MVTRAKIFRLHDPVYGCDFTFYRGSWEGFNKWLAALCPDVAVAVMEVIGHRVGHNASEPLTYYHDWLVREATQGLHLEKR